MKKRVLLLSLYLLLAGYNHLPAQVPSTSIFDAMSGYYLEKDGLFFEKTVGELNRDVNFTDGKGGILLGFFGALFKHDSIARHQYCAGTERFENPQIKALFGYLCTVSIDSIYAQTTISPAINDMYWASFFATGNPLYIDSLIANTAYADNRTDVYLYLTGATAQWSLSSNFRKHPLVLEHLENLRKSDKRVEIYFTKTSGEIHTEMIRVLQEGKQKGTWKLK